MSEAIKLHLAGMKEDNIPLPAPRSVAEYIALEF
jgi:predicted RNase H-like HicB family nuclease